MKWIAVLTLSLSLMACSSTKQAPQPVEWKKGALTPEQAAQAMKDAERRQPCSEEHMKNATEEQKRHCDPTRGMFEKTRPAAPRDTKSNKPKH